MVDQAEKAKVSLSPQINGRVQKIISELNSLTADAEVENLPKAVRLPQVICCGCCGHLLRERSPATAEMGSR
jgi:hypothetical protein